MTSTRVRPVARRPVSPAVTTTRAVIYLRISSDDDQERQGVDRQVEDCRRYAERADWSVVAVLEDNDVSASENSTKARPGYETVVRMVTAGEVDVVLCTSLDRLYRRPKELEDFLPLVDRHGVRLVTVDGTTVQPGEGALMVRMSAAFAAEEARKIKVRVRRKMLANAEQGHKHGRTPYGWQLVTKVTLGEPDRVVSEPKDGEAEHVTDLIDRLLAGDALKAIARDWNARGVPLVALKHKVKAADGSWLRGPDGKVVRELIERPWDAQGLRALACRPSNAGLREYTDRDGNVVTVKGFWPALVTEDKWRSVVALFDSRRRLHASRTYLLSGLMDCECGGKFGGTRRKNPVAAGGVVVRSMYRCMDCQRVSMQVDYVDAHVEQATVDRLRRGDFADLLGAARDTAARVAADRVQALRDRKADAARSFGRELIDLEQLEEITAEVNPLLRMAEAEADRLTSGRAAALDGLTGEDPDTRWVDLSTDRKRAVISLLWSITILPRGDTYRATEDRLLVVEKGTATST